MAVAGLLDSAEWEMDFGANGRCIDVGDSSVEVADGGKRSVDVLGVERGRESVLYVVGDLDAVFKRIARDAGDDGAKDFLLGDAHLGSYVGEDGGLDEESVGEIATFDAMATGGEMRSFVLAYIDVAENGFHLLLADDRTDLDVFIQSVTEAKLFGAGHELIDEALVHAFLNNDAAGGCAALSGGAESSPECAFEREFEIGIVEHDHRILAAVFERAALEGACATLADDASYLARSGEGDGADQGVLHERRADLSSVSGDDVDDTGRDSGLSERADEVKDRERRVLCGLDDAGVAGDEGREEFPGRNCHGEVPRTDHSDNTDRIAGTHGKFVGQFAGRGQAVHAAAFSGEEVSAVDGFLSVTASFLDDLPHFAGHVAGECFLLPFEDTGRFHDDFGAAGSGNAAPLLEGSGGGFNGEVDLSGAGALENADHFAGVGRITVLAGVSGAGRNPFAIDEVAEGFDVGSGGGHAFLSEDEATGYRSRGRGAVARGRDGEAKLRSIQGTLRGGCSLFGSAEEEGPGRRSAR